MFSESLYLLEVHHHHYHFYFLLKTCALGYLSQTRRASLSIVANTIIANAGKTRASPYFRTLAKVFVLCPFGIIDTTILSTCLSLPGVPVASLLGGGRGMGVQFKYPHSPNPTETRDKQQPGGYQAWTQLEMCYL